jgi:hypothetical protein
MALARPAASFAEYQHRGEGGDTRIHMDGGATGEVEGA